MAGTCVFYGHTTLTCTISFQAAQGEGGSVWKLPRCVEVERIVAQLGAETDLVAKKAMEAQQRKARINMH